MKIRNHRRNEWWFFPTKTSKLNRGTCYRFKKKSSLMGFLTANINEAVNGEVRLEQSSFGISGCVRMWTVWYNQNEYRKGADLKADLRQLDFRGRKWVHKPQPISKSSKKYFAFSEKVISLMCRLQDESGAILPKDAKKLVELFYKRGFADFTPTVEDNTYIYGHISDGIDFHHWSDRCDWLRTKTIIEYFKKTNLI